MSRKLKFLALGLAAILVSGPGLAQEGARDHLAGWRAGGVPEARATVSGTDEKTLVHKKGPGHYSICNSGSHDLAVSHDESALDVAPGDCVSVEASKIAVKGTNDNAHNTATVYNHTLWHARGGDH